METTGLSNDETIEIFMKEMNSIEESDFYSKIKNTRKFQTVTWTKQKGFYVHKINEKDLLNEPTKEEVAKKLELYIDSLLKEGDEIVFIAHNGKRFDHPRLKKLLNLDDNGDYKGHKIKWMDSLDLTKMIVGKEVSLDDLISMSDIRINETVRHTAKYDVVTTIYSLLSLIKTNVLDDNNGDAVVEFENWITKGEINPIRGPLVEKIYELSFLEKIKNPVTGVQCDLWKVPTHLNSRTASLYMDKYVGLFFNKKFTDTNRKLIVSERRSNLLEVVKKYHQMKQLKEDLSEEEMDLFIEIQENNFEIEENVNELDESGENDERLDDHLDRLLEESNEQDVIDGIGDEEINDNFGDDMQCEDVDFTSSTSSEFTFDINKVEANGDFVPKENKSTQKKKQNMKRKNNNLTKLKNTKRKLNKDDEDSETEWFGTVYFSIFLYFLFIWKN